LTQGVCDLFTPPSAVSTLPGVGGGGAGDRPRIPVMKGGSGYPGSCRSRSQALLLVEYPCRRMRENASNIVVQPVQGSRASGERVPKQSLGTRGKRALGGLHPSPWRAIQQGCDIRAVPSMATGFPLPCDIVESLCRPPRSSVLRLCLLNAAAARRLVPREHRHE